MLKGAEIKKEATSAKFSGRKKNKKKPILKDQ